MTENELELRRHFPATDRSAWRQAAELTLEGRSLDDLTARQIFDRGERQIATGNPDDAAFTFGEVERLYPYSELAERALIMQAYAYHRDQDYPNSRAAAQRYLDTDRYMLGTLYPEEQAEP